MTTSTGTPGHATIGGYRLLARIGEGGMGIVHLAQRGDGGPRVALKVLRPHVIGDAEARRRLAQEVGALERVHSPRIAEILDADPYGDTPYVVTRYVPGLSLNRHVEEEGPIHGKDLLHFATCLAEALAEVHRVVVLHRDVKPSNVLMEGRSPVLIDFGLARAAEDPTLTATGFMLGTPGYLPPEVLYGDAATPASDLYAWAATTAFAATGRAPFGRGHTMAIMDRVRRGEHDLSGVPDPLRGLLAECLAAEPLDRPTVGEVLRQLRGWQEPTAAWTRPVSAPAPSPIPPRESAHDRGSDDTLTSLLASEVFEPPSPARSRGERSLRVLQRLALGALLAAAIAFAPYVVLLAVAVLVLLVRTASVARQRHLRRQGLRGRARWYDVPTTTLSLPGYLLLASGGTVALVVVAALAGSGVTALATLLGEATGRAVLFGAVVLVPLLWWGPGSSRVREMVDPLIDRNARSPRGALAVVAVSLILALGLVAAVTVSGPNWYPQLQAPWQ